jgi:plastocyanin
MGLFLFLALVAMGAACSSGASPASPTPAPPPTATPAPAPAPSGPPTVTITAAGMSPLEITITVGRRVTFVNNDTRPHDVVGGVDPNNPDCPEIAQAGFLAPGQRGETAVFTTARTCEYHDHTMLSVPAFQGRIIIR